MIESILSAAKDLVPTCSAQVGTRSFGASRFRMTSK